MDELVNKIHQGHAIDVLKEFPDKCINMLMTSPPYWALRDYGEETEREWADGWKGQLGLEPTFDLYIKHLCDIFDEVKRVLRDDGTIWVNLGDTYSGSGMGTWNPPDDYKSKQVYFLPKGKNKSNKISYPSKSLVMIPFRFAIEMVNRGWILRNTIIWHKRNCMPSSVKDRFTVDFEYLFFFSKNKKYYFEQQFDKYIKPMNRWGGEQLKPNGISSWDEGTGQKTYRDRNMRPNLQGRNKRTTWTINPQPFPDAHFAIFPPELCETPIKASCPEKGIVLEPFAGSGTACLVAKQMGRRYVGIDINEKYVKMAKKRLAKNPVITDWI